MKNKLQKIFYAVRKKFIWTADDSHELNFNGQTITLKDHWALMEPDKHGILRGDCEDFSLYCSKIIKQELDIPHSRRRLTYCKTEIGDGHMILCVTVDDKDYVFDYRQRRLTTLRRLKRSGYSDFAQSAGSIDQPWERI